jgi:hypothetical protein
MAKNLILVPVLIYAIEETFTFIILSFLLRERVLRHFCGDEQCG